MVRSGAALQVERLGGRWWSGRWDPRATRTTTRFTKSGVAALPGFERHPELAATDRGGDLGDRRCRHVGVAGARRSRRSTRCRRRGAARPSPLGTGRSLGTRVWRVPDGPVVVTISSGFSGKTAGNGSGSGWLIASSKTGVAITGLGTSRYVEVMPVITAPRATCASSVVSAPTTEMSVTVFGWIGRPGATMTCSLSSDVDVAVVRAVATGRNRLVGDHVDVGDDGQGLEIGVDVRDGRVDRWER